MNQASTLAWLQSLVPSGIISGVVAALAWFEHLPTAVIATIVLVLAGIGFICTLAWFGYRNEQLACPSDTSGSGAAATANSQEIEIVSPKAEEHVPRVCPVRVGTKFSADRLQVWIYSNGSRKWYPQSQPFRQDGDHLTADNCTFGSDSDPSGTFFKVAVREGRMNPGKYEYLPAGTISQIVEVYRL